MRWFKKRNVEEYHPPMPKRVDGEYRIIEQLDHNGTRVYEAEFYLNGKRQILTTTTYTALTTYRAEVPIEPVHSYHTQYQLDNDYGYLGTITSKRQFASEHKASKEACKMYRKAQQDLIDSQDRAHRAKFNKQRNVVSKGVCGCE